jgi:hypothetical protein
MQRFLFIALSVILVGLASCAARPRQKAAEEEVLTLDPPGPLDDAWSRWLVGDWDIAAESDLQRCWAWASSS